jgi:hypothetical protein
MEFSSHVCQLQYVYYTIVCVAPNTHVFITSESVEFNSAQLHLCFIYLFQSVYHQGLRSKLIHIQVYLGPLHRLVVWIFLLFLNKDFNIFTYLYNIKCVTVMRQTTNPLISDTLAVLILKLSHKIKIFSILCSNFEWCDEQLRLK